MNIGSFAMKNGQLVGSVATATIDLSQLGLRPVQNDKPRAPAFDIMALNVARRWVQIGALWEMVSNTSGEVFYQGKLDDPSMIEPLQIALFGNDAEGYRVVWNRPTPRREAMDGGRKKGKSNADDGFGEGNATSDGQLADHLNDEIPAF